MGAIIVDLDGTLCDHTHRVHLAEAKKWDEYNSRLADDRVNKGILSLMESMSHRHRILLCTGRSEAYRHLTVAWLHANDVGCWDELLMRKLYDHRHDWEVKESMLNELYFGDRNKIIFAIEDRKQVVDMWRRNGILTLQCAEGNF